MFLQPFNCSYLLNQLLNLHGVFTRLKFAYYPKRKCLKKKKWIFRLQTHSAWTHHILLMEINLRTRRYCLTHRQSQRKRTHSHKYAQNTRAWINHTAVRRVDNKSCCQGHKFALNAVWLSACIPKFLSSNYRSQIYTK